MEMELSGNVDLSGDNDQLEINALYADLEDDMMDDDLVLHGDDDLGVGLEPAETPDIDGNGGWGGGGGAVELEDHNPGVSEAHMIMLDDDALDPELHDSGLIGSLPVSARHSVASDRPPSTQAALEPSRAEPEMHQASLSRQPSSQEQQQQQQPGRVEIVYAADASDGNSPRDGEMTNVDQNAGSEGSPAAYVPHHQSVGAAQGLEVAMPKDDGDAHGSEQYTPPYTPPGEPTPPYTPPGGQSEARDDEVPQPYVPPASQEPEEIVPVADTDPSSHDVYSYATFDRDDTEEKAPGSPRGFLGEVFTLDRIGATPSFKSIKGEGGQDDTTTSTAAAAPAQPDASAAHDIDALMANLDFSTAGPPSQKSGPSGKAAPGKKGAKQSSLAQQISGTVAEMEQDAASRKRTQASSGVTKAKNRAAASSASATGGRSGSAPRERKGPSPGRERSGSMDSSPERRQGKDKSPLQKREKGWNTFTKSATNQAKKGQDPASKAFLKVQGPTKEEAKKRKQWTVERIRIKEEQEKKFQAKRKAAEEAALKEKETRAQEIRERLEAKAVARQQKREEDRERAKKAAMAGSKGKPLYQRLEEQARKAAARDEAEKRMKYEIELGSVRKQKTTAIIKGASTAHDDLMTTLTRSGTRHSDCLEEPFYSSSEHMMHNGTENTNFVDDGRSPRERLPPMPENEGYWGGADQSQYEPGDQMAEYQPMGNHFHSLIQQDYHGKGFLPPIMESPASTYKGDSTQGAGSKGPVEQAEVATSMGDSFKGDLGLPPLGERPRPLLSDVVAFNVAIGGPPKASKPSFHGLDDITLEELAKSMPDEEPAAEAEKPAPATATANTNQTNEAAPAVFVAEAEDITTDVIIPDKAIEATKPSDAAQQFQGQAAIIDEPVEAVLADRPPSGGDHGPGDEPDRNKPKTVSGTRSNSLKLKALQRSPSNGSRRGSLTARKASNAGSELPPPSPPTHAPDEIDPATTRSQRPPGRRRSSAGSLAGERSNSAGSSRKNLGQLQSMESSGGSEAQSEAVQDTTTDAMVNQEPQKLTGIAALRQISMRRRSGSSESSGSRKESAAGRLRQQVRSPGEEHPVLAAARSTSLRNEAATPEDPDDASQHAVAAEAAARQEDPDVVEEAATSPGIRKEEVAEPKEGHEASATDEAMIEEKSALQHTELPLAEERIDGESLEDDGDATVDYLDQYEPDLEVPDQTEGDVQVPSAMDGAMDEAAISHHDSGSEYDLEIPPAAASVEEHNLDGDMMLDVHEVATSLKPENLEPAPADDNHLPEALSQDTHSNSDDGGSLPNGNSNADQPEMPAVPAANGDLPELPTEHREATPASSQPSQGSRGKAGGTASSTLMDSDEISFGSVPNQNYRISQASDVPFERHEGLVPVIENGSPIVSQIQEDGPDATVAPSGNHQGVDCAEAAVDGEHSDSEDDYDDDDYEDDFEDDFASSSKSLLPRTGSVDVAADQQQKKSSLPIWLQ